MGGSSHDSDLWRGRPNEMSVEKRVPRPPLVSFAHTLLATTDGCFHNLHEPGCACRHEGELPLLPWSQRKSRQTLTPVTVRPLLPDPDARACARFPGCASPRCRARRCPASEHRGGGGACVLPLKRAATLQRAEAGQRYSCRHLAPSPYACPCRARTRWKRFGASSPSSWAWSWTRCVALQLKKGGHPMGSR